MPNTKLTQITEDLVRLAEEVGQERLAEFDVLIATKDKKLYDFSEGFVSGKKELGKNFSPCPKAPIKYAIYPRRHIEKFLVFLPFFCEHSNRSAFEIGVGPGYLFYMLEKLFDIRMSGVDIRLKEEIVYRRLRENIGISKNVFEHKVVSRQDIPITEASDILIAFWTVFNKLWTVADHEWFLDQCREKLVGPRLVYLRFNNEGFQDNDDVRALYKRRGEFPLSDDPNFCVIAV